MRGEARARAAAVTTGARAAVATTGARATGARAIARSCLHAAPHVERSARTSASAHAALPVGGACALGGAGGALREKRRGREGCVRSGGGGVRAVDVSSDRARADRPPRGARAAASSGRAGGTRCCARWRAGARSGRAPARTARQKLRARKPCSLRRARESRRRGRHEGRSGSGRSRHPLRWPRASRRPSARSHRSRSGGVALEVAFARCGAPRPREARRGERRASQVASYAYEGHDCHVPSPSSNQGPRARPLQRRP